MRTYSIVFLDIDGTLLDSRHQVMPCTHNRLQYLHGRGVPIVLCSARPPEGVNLVARQVGVQGPMVLMKVRLFTREKKPGLRTSRNRKMPVSSLSIRN